jgi:hypothetical protein
LIDEKITRYKKDIDKARKLAKNNFADMEYYEQMASKLEKILRFYENLRDYNK